MIPRLRGLRQGMVGIALLGAIAGLSIMVAPASAVTGWTGPQAIGSAASCFDVNVAIDATGRYHVAAICNGHVQYSSSNPNGSWSTTTFSHPSGTADVGPQIAIDGATISIAFNRVTPMDCGVGRVGIYVRTRSLTGATWSAATLLGHAGDRLQSFRAEGGKIHATVDSDYPPNTSHVYYETYSGGVLKRYVLAGAGYQSSLRVGGDGRARIVYEVAVGLRYAVFNGVGLTTSSIPGTTANDHNPLLVLDAQNKAYVIWTHEEPAGCAPGTAEALDGTYYATNRTGSWTAAASRRFTTVKGPAAITLDAGSGRAYVLVAARTSGLRYWTKPVIGAWSSQLLSSVHAGSVAIRRNASDGKLLAVYTSPKIRFFTKP
jgi:hypothetical protein